MNKAQIQQVWDHFRAVNGIGLRAIASLPTEQLDAHPVPGMRTPKELACHIYQSLDDLTAAVAKGEAWDSAPAEEAAARSLRTTDELVAWCRQRWDAASRTVQGLTDAQIAGIVKTPWGHDFPGHVLLDIVIKEYWHHRGQLYCFLRALGIAPASIYDFEHNAPEFQPGLTTTT